MAKQEITGATTYIGLTYGCPQTVYELYGLKSGSLGVCYAERLDSMTIFQAETDYSILIYT